MAANRRWASREDWERHRPLITRLYIAERRSLAEVVDVLRLEHDFFATKLPIPAHAGISHLPCNKDRLRRWGLYKYATTSNLEPQGKRTNASARNKGSLAPTSASPKGLPPELPHTKCTDAACSIWNPEAQAIAEGVGPPKTELVPLAAPARPLSANKYRTFEVIFHLFHNHLSGDSVVFDRSYWSQETSAFYRLAESSARLLDAKDMRAGFQSLDQCFSRFQDMVDSSEFTIIPVFFIVIARLPPEVAQLLLRFAARMAAIRLPRGHPLVGILDAVRNSGPGVVRENCHAIVRAFFAAVEDRLGVAHENAMLLESYGLDMMHYLDVRAAAAAGARALDAAALERRMRTINDRLARFGYCASAQWGRLNYGYLCLREARYAEACAIADGVILWAEQHRDDEHFVKLTRASFHLKWRVEESIGSPDSYAAAAVRFCRFCLASAEPDDGRRVMTAVAEIKVWFQDKGVPELAQRVVDEATESPAAQ